MGVSPSGSSVGRKSVGVFFSAMGDLEKVGEKGLGEVVWYCKIKKM